ncbi:MAG: DUF3795 domain-containing protein [candidate division Zixibacteria bacterium]|nr:DUF3795 domain-containing protein [candidate division Zixibacteria bacterium]
MKDQIGFCGIWCGSCVVGNGVLRELTGRYEEVIRAYGLQEWGPKEFDFREFMKGLRSIQEMPLCQGCRKGDGKPNCEIRICASGKKINDCSECDQSSDCKNSDALQKMREGALRTGLFVKTENLDRRKLIRKWTSELKGKWPHSILFMPDEP